MYPNKQNPAKAATETGFMTEVNLFNSNDMSIIASTETNFEKYVQTLPSKVWKLPAFQVTVGVDTEYVQKPNHPNQMITTQIGYSQTHVDVWEHPSLELNILPSWDSETLLSKSLGLTELTFETAPKVDCFLIIDVMMFFAPADFLAGLFRSKSLCRSIQRYIVQDARCRIDTKEKHHPNLFRLGIYVHTPFGLTELVLKLTDLGKLSVGTLQQNVQAFGGVMEAKNLMDEYKSNMLVPYTDPTLRQDFIKYAKEDVAWLFFLRKAASERTKMLYDVHNLPHPRREYLTTGALVADLDIAYFDAKIGDNVAYVLYQEKDAKGRAKGYDLKTMLDKATVNNFAQRKGYSSQALALVQGGRAKNERPNVVRLFGAIADNDISGAYVSIQRALLYPIGIPAVYEQHESSKTVLTVGKFLKKYGSELMPRLYSVVVSGKLRHCQTLVPSKVVDCYEVNESYSEDDPKIPADFRLYTHEIINGVITSDVLETLENVCSDKEWKDWMDLEVVSAIWYPASMMNTDAKTWKARVKEHQQKTGNAIERIVDKTGKTEEVDNRSREWLAVPLEDFLKPYADLRKKYKSERKKFDKGSPEYMMLDAQQNAMKLVGNVNYGVMASPYFSAGNVVISNVITAAARVGVWLHACAMGAFQSITDGGAYDLNNVRYWTAHKPGMNTLSLWRDIDRLDRVTAKGLKTAPLALKPDVLSRLKTAPLAGESQWVIKPTGNKGEGVISNGEQTFTFKEETGLEFFDNASLEHIRQFFREPRRGNGISLLNVLQFAHKNLYTSAVFHSQTNYRFEEADGSVKYKARGYKVKGKRYNKESEVSNICILMDTLLDNPSAVPPFRPQTISQVLKCNQANRMMDSATDNAYKRNDLLAGDSIIKRTWVKPLSLSMFHFQSDEQYQSWNKRHEYLKEKSGYGLEQFWLADDGTFNYQQAVIDIQTAIDEGMLWLHPLTKGRKVEPVINHPYLAVKETLERFPELDPNDIDITDLT